MMTRRWTCGGGPDHTDEVIFATSDCAGSLGAKQGPAGAGPCGRTIMAGSMATEGVAHFDQATVHPGPADDRRRATGLGIVG